MVIMPNNDCNRLYGNCDRIDRNGNYDIKTTTVMMIMTNDNNNLIGEYGK